MKLEERTFGTPCIYIFLTNLLKFFVKYIDIFVLFFCLLVHRLAVRNSCCFMIFFKLLYWTRSTTGRSGTTQRFVAVDLLIFYVINQKRVRVFDRGIQTPRNRWKHEAVGRVLLLFRGVWRPRSNTTHEFLIWLLKLFTLL